MDKLWAPWRSRYLETIGKKTKGCIFCGLLLGRQDRKNLIFARSAYSFAILNLYPYSNGHVLVMPKRHVGDWQQLSLAEKLDLLELFSTTQKLLEQTLKPEGFNMGMNIGKAGGAGVPGHLHLHVVPRWVGDVNFMPVLTKTKVISQSLTALHRLLVNAQRKKGTPKSRRPVVRGRKR